MSGPLGWHICDLWRTWRQRIISDGVRNWAWKTAGWHTDAIEETQYIIGGNGELHMEDGSKHPVGPPSVFAIATR